VKKYLDENRYGQFGDNWDDLLFRQEIERTLQNNHSLLDLGAGAGIVSHMNFKGMAARVVGVDLDPRVTENPFLDKGIIIDGVTLPFPDGEFDIVISDNVLEHLENPSAIFSEVFRVLKKGGCFLVKTPNKFHYMPLVASLTPTSFHRYVNRLRGRDSEDTFPTLYRVNSKRSVGRLSTETGFSSCKVSLIEGRPEYLRMYSLTYVFGYIYERFVNSSNIFQNFRILLIAVMQK